MPKPRIAILGGGAGAVATALQLSKPGWQQHFESITIYQQGWRLGGKGACGRGFDRRIEEHGLHIWFGFYENAFQLLDRCHRELDALAEGPNAEPRWKLAFKDVEQSFSRLEEVGVADYDGCGWKLWLADFFGDYDDRPWEVPDPRPPGERPDEWTVAFYLVRCLRLAADVAWSLVRSDPGLEMIAEPAGQAREGAAGLDDAIDLVTAALGGDIQTLLGATADLVDALAEEAFDQPGVLAALGIAVRALDLVVDFVRRREDELLRHSDATRRAYYVVDLMLAIARGVIEDGVIAADSFTVIEDVDLREWLLAHGAERESVDCALIRALVYDLGFAYVGGDPMRPSCAAGTALRGLLRAFFTYRGSLMWKMNSGMGDVIFLPFFELLVKRGVGVRFFHRVEAVRTANGLIEEVEIDVQAKVPPGTTPESYVTPAPAGAAGAAGASGTFAWPADPRAVLGGSAATASTAAETYESWYAARAAAHVETKVLKRGAPDGFDLVVFGLPISCVPNVAPGLLAESQRWQGAVDHLQTVPTQAMQLWLDCPAPDFADVDSGTVISGFVKPFDTWADMSQIVPEEEVEGSATVAYFCSVLPDSEPPERGQAQDWLDQQHALVFAGALRFLTYDIAAIWPGAVDPISGELDWNRLIAPQQKLGSARLGAQYLRANVEPSERYVLSVPGSSEHRIPPDETGFANLYAVGDWTACAIDAGCVEGAVISGMLAANAIHRAHGDPGEVEPIVGLESP
jgi:uncharacterized protein with NAD-binding domain and iron-sulfur cluster